MSYLPTGDWCVLDEAGRRKYLNTAERERFLAVADSMPEDLRTLCHLLAFTGCRISEALALQAHMLDRERCAVTFRTLKRRRRCFRTVPIPEELVRMLLILPISDGGKFWPMHRATAWRQIKTVMDLAQVVGPMASCKGLRHGYGIACATKGIPPNLIQRWLGHATSTTSAIYLDAVGLEERAFARRLWDGSH